MQLHNRYYHSANGKVTEAKNLFVEQNEAVKILGGDTIETKRKPRDIKQQIHALAEGKKTLDLIWVGDLLGIFQFAMCDRTFALFHNYNHKRNLRQFSATFEISIKWVFLRFYFIWVFLFPIFFMVIFPVNVKK